MRLNFDGTTPMSRMLLLSALLLHSDFHVVLERPVFVAAGDLVSYRDDTLVVTDPVGEQHRCPARDSYWICR
ncbi:hypothetical protein ABZW10_24510 [Kitasatospora sp. NPDC004723]|uniref:hypothetical protein n=1 Tax=Kitasatospora sp. NPDC004723 TaxID=3154288 RepID=UPI0033A1281C